MANSDIKIQTLWISINPDLMDGFGHYLHFDLKVMSQMSDQDKGLIFSHNSWNKSEISIPDNIQVIPSFTQRTYDLIPLIGYSYLKNFRLQIKQVIQQIKAIKSFQKIIYFYTSSLWHAWAIVEALHQVDKIYNASWIINLFHHRKALMHHDFDKSVYKLEYIQIVNALYEYGPQLGVNIVLDTQQVIDKMYDITGVRLPLMPMFSLTRNLHKKTHSNFQNKKLLHLVYPTNVQKEKGFGLLAEMLQYLNLTHFVVTIRTSVKLPQKEQKKWLESIPRHPHVKTLDKDLSAQEFADLIQTADVLLIPYLKQDFAGRTTGIYADALQTATPTVVTAGTWAASQSEKYHNGTIISDPPDGLKFAQAISAIYQNYEQYFENAQRAQSQWKNKNGIENFIKFLIALNINKIETKSQRIEVGYIAPVVRSIRKRQKKGFPFIVEKMRRSKWAKKLKYWYFRTH